VKNPSGTLQEKSNFGEFFWTDWEKAEDFYRKNIGESEAQRQILKRIQDKNDEQFCLEEELKLKAINTEGSSVDLVELWV